MKHTFQVLGIFALASFTLAGCKTAGDTLAEDATPFTRGELYAYVSDMTQITGDGAVFYSAEGTVETLKDGERDSGTFSTYENGSLCRHVKAWGETPCETYYHNGDVVSIVSGATTALAGKMHHDNVLEYIEAGTAPPVKTAEEMEPEVVVLFTKEETTAFVSGKTVVWGERQGAYYNPDGTLETIWDGEKVTGTWSVNDEGGVCWHVSGWGTTPCESYYQGTSGLMAIYQGNKSPADEHQDGNTIGSF